MEHLSIFAWLKENLIMGPSDFFSIPGYEPTIDFGKFSGRRLDIMFTDYAFDKANETQCGISGCKQKHQNGYIVCTNDGKITNIGKDCGKTHLGLDFNRAKKQLGERRKAESNLSTIANALAEITAQQARIDRLRTIAKSLTACSFSFRRLMPDTYKKVCDMARRDNPVITRPKALTGREAELYFESTKTRPSDFPGGIPVIDEAVETLSGCRFFRDQIGAFVTKKIIKPIEELSSLTQSEINELSKKRLSSLSKSAQSILSDLSVAEENANHGRAFFNAKNMERLRLLGASSTSIEQLKKEFTDAL